MIFCLLFEVGPDYLYHVGRGFFSGFWIARQVIADMIFQQPSLEAVDGTVGGCEAVEHVRALFIFIQAAQNAF